MSEPLTDEELALLDSWVNSRPEGTVCDNIEDIRRVARAVAEIRTLWTENARLREYVQHDHDCNTITGYDKGACTCGLDDILKPAAEPAGKPDDK